jgi:protein phosphatase
VRDLTVFGRAARSIRLEVFGKTDRGRTRDHNEDCFLTADLTRRTASVGAPAESHEMGDRGSLLVVADGMGGAAAGELASQLATETIYEHLATTWGAERDERPERFAQRLKEAVEAANARIHTHATTHPELRGMGTTATAAGLLGPHAYISQIGDSRAYLVRHGRAIQLTKDQSLMQRLVEAGELTEEEAARSERRNIILQALGPEPRIRVDLTHQELRRGDRLVLCSDGLSGQVRGEEIAALAGSSDDLADACARLVGLANERGGPDNITVVIAQLEGDGLRPPDAAAEVGHQVFPLIDTETSTEPVPVYRGSPVPRPAARRTRARRVAWLVAAGAALAAWYLLRGP